MSKVKLKQKQIISYETVDGNKKTYEVNNDINKEIKKLSKLNLISLEIKNKNVTDEFLEFYKDGE